LLPLIPLLLFFTHWTNSSYLSYANGSLELQYLPHIKQRETFEITNLNQKINGITNVLLVESEERSGIGLLADDQVIGLEAGGKQYEVDLELLGIGIQLNTTRVADADIKTGKPVQLQLIATGKPTYRAFMLPETARKCGIL
jgi:hypothetical protein